MNHLFTPFFFSLFDTMNRRHTLTAQQLNGRQVQRITFSLRNSDLSLFGNSSVSGVRCGSIICYECGASFVRDVVNDAAGKNPSYQQLNAKRVKTICVCVPQTSTDIQLAVSECILLSRTSSQSEFQHTIQLVICFPTDFLLQCIALLLQLVFFSLKFVLLPAYHSVHSVHVYFKYHCVIGKNCHSTKSTCFLCSCIS